jgi:hypothetical protein
VTLPAPGWSLICRARRRPQWLAVVILLGLGGAWIVALTTLNGAAQAILPNWVRGRGLAVNLMIVNGAMGGGSLGWGIVAGVLSVPATLLVSACGLAVVASVLYRIRLPAGEADLKPSNYWPERLTDDTIEHDRGPVLVLIDYRIARDDRPKFLECLKLLSQARRRDGAYGWGITEDAADSERIVEWFMVESWAEHLRQASSPVQCRCGYPARNNPVSHRSRSSGRTSLLGVGIGAYWPVDWVGLMPGKKRLSMRPNVPPLESMR